MFKNLTIGRKIAFGFAIVLVLTAILATVGILQIRTVDTSVMDLADVHIPLTAAVTEIDAGATAQNLSVSLYALHKEDSYLEEFASLGEGVDASLENAAKFVKADDELVSFGWSDTIETIATTHDVFVKSCRDFIEVIKDTTSDTEKIQSAADVVEGAYKPLMAKIDEFLETNSEEIAAVSAGATKAADTGNESMGRMNSAVSQMDKVTQQNAANAEESASASEELSAQAEQMNQIVAELSAMVGGSSSKGQTRSATGPRNKGLSVSDQAFHQIATKPKAASAKPQKAQTKASAEKAIPLNDSDDFGDFNS
jgi:CHASE3 domain sensor protein